MNSYDKKRIFDVQICQQEKVVQPVIQKTFLFRLHVYQHTKQEVYRNSRSHKTPKLVVCSTEWSHL